MGDRYNLYMAKYVGWYMFWRFGCAAVLFDMLPWFSESVFNTPVVYSPWVALFLNFASVVGAAFATGYFFAESYKKLPTVIEARILAGTLIAWALIFFAVEQLLLTWLYVETATIAASRATVEDLFGKPRILTTSFHIFYAFYLLFHYWLIGWLFTKGAACFLCFLKKREIEKVS